MCELFGMSSNVPTDICFSLSGLMQRGGKTGPHSDGWGVAFYEGKGCRLFQDPDPSAHCKIAEFIRTYPINSTKVISHIRRANRGRICLENTHPFIKQLWGLNWCFAHNGQLKFVKKQLPVVNYLPIGTTDSEHVFCWMLEQIQKKFKSYPKNHTTLWKFIESLSDEIREFGVFNFLMSDSKYLYSHCSTKMVWATRKAPFGRVKLVDDEVEIDFTQIQSEKDLISIIATQPLTHNEVWHRAKKGNFLVFKNGLITYQNF